MASRKLIRVELTTKEHRALLLDRFKQWYEGDPEFAQGVQEIVANGE